jgi:fido (protein-threonine AMPylation protein)
LPIIKDQESVIEGLFDFVGQSRALSTSYIKELHQALTAHQTTVEAVDQFGKYMTVEFKRGAWKDQPNNPTTSDGTIHHYCPPEHVPGEMDRLIAMHLAHQAANVPPEVEAAWLHHRFTQIHPFQDGNGRVARALASLIFLRAGWFPLVVVSDQHRDEYISACEEADHCDLASLVALFARLQKQAFIAALSISRDVLDGQASLKKVIASVADLLRDQGEIKREEKSKVFEISEELEQKTQEFLESVRVDIQTQLAGLASYQASVDRSAPETEYWFWNQIVETAKHFSYFSDLRTYHAWTRLKIRNVGERQTELVISFHSLGTSFAGVMAASAFIEHRVLGEDGAATVDGPYPVCDHIFEFSYKQDFSAVSTGFEKWLNNVLVNGLEQWRRQI